MPTTPPDLHAVADDPEPGWGPTRSGGRRRRWRWIALTLVVVILPTIYALTLIGRVNASIHRVEVTGLAAAGDGPLHVLVIGSDSREGLSSEQQTQLTTGYVEGERTDSIFVLTVDRGRAGLLAFPRDLYVRRCDGSEGRINAALSRGGPECLVRSVSDLSGIPIQHYVAVSFGGFVDIVDAVGGVDLCLDKPLNDPYAGVDLQAGCQTLSGANALGYVRTRHLDSDLERIKRQQAFLSALAARLATPATVLSPARAWNVTGAVGGALTADGDLGLSDLLTVANGLRGLAAGGAVTATVPATPATIGGAAVLVPDLARAEPLFAGFRDASLLRSAGDEPSRAEIEVRVLNGAGVGGLAAATRDALATLGYRVVGIGDADRRDTSEIRYPTGQRGAAEVLARDLPTEVTLTETASVTIVTLTLGRDLASGVSP